MKRVNLPALAAVAEIIGTVGIIVSLIFVAIGIRDNTGEVRAAQINTIYDGSREIELLVAADPEWVDILLRGRDGTVPLSEMEQWRYDAYLTSYLDLWDKLNARAQDGLMEANELEAWDAYFQRWAQYYMSDRDWERVRWQFPDSTVASKLDALDLGLSPTDD